MGNVFRLFIFLVFLCAAIIVFVVARINNSINEAYWIIVLFLGGGVFLLAPIFVEKKLCIDKEVVTLNIFLFLLFLDVYFLLKIVSSGGIFILDEHTGVFSKIKSYIQNLTGINGEFVLYFIFLPIIIGVCLKIYSRIKITTGGG